MSNITTNIFFYCPSNSHYSKFRAVPEANMGPWLGEPRRHQTWSRMFHFQGGAPRTRHGGCPGVAGTCARPTISRRFVRFKSLQQPLVFRAQVPSRRKLFLSLSDLHPIRSYPRPKTPHPSPRITSRSHRTRFTAARPPQPQPCVWSKSNPKKTTSSRTASSTGTNLGVATPHTPPTPLSAATRAPKSCTNPHAHLHPTSRSPRRARSRSPRHNPSPYSLRPRRLPCPCRLHRRPHITATTRRRVTMRRRATTAKRTTSKCRRAPA
jgi:hypothetical protein